MEDVDIAQLTTPEKAKELELLGEMTAPDSSLIIPSTDNTKTPISLSPNTSTPADAVLHTSPPPINLNLAETQSAVDVEVDNVNVNIETENTPETVVDTAQNENESMPPLEDFSMIPKESETLGDNISMPPQEDFSIIEEPEARDEIASPAHDFSLVELPAAETVVPAATESSSDFSTAVDMLPPSTTSDVSSDPPVEDASETVPITAPAPVDTESPAPAPVETEPTATAPVETEPPATAPEVPLVEPGVSVSDSVETFVTATDVEISEASPMADTSPPPPESETSQSQYAEPEAAVPSVIETSIPETATVPESSVPDTVPVPEASVPETVPESSVPETVTIPESSVPETVTVPEASVPETVTVPESSVPETVIVPEASVPETVTVPEASVPETVTPEKGVADEAAVPEEADTPVTQVEEEDAGSIGSASYDIIGPEEVTQSLEDVKELEEQEQEASPDWLNVLGNDQLKKRMKKPGKGDNLEKGQQVTMKYSLLLASGKEVHVDVEQTFQLGDGEVMTAIDLTCNLAKVGEVFEVVSAARFAYKEHGCSPHIPPNASVLMTIEILRCEDTPRLEDMTEAERINIGDRKRNTGNNHFKRHDYEAASNNYSGACKYLDPPSYKVQGEASPEIKDLQFKSWCNLAIAELKLQKYDSGIQAANRALELEPQSTKAMYRKGKLLAGKGEYEDAEKLLKKACEIEPSSQGCKQFLKELSTTIYNQKKKQQKMYKKMFNLEDEKKKDGGKAGGSFGETTWLQGAIPMVTGAVAIGALAVAVYSGLKSM